MFLEEKEKLLVGGANGWLTVLTLNLGEESVPSVTLQGDDLRECDEVQDRL